MRVLLDTHTVLWWLNGEQPIGPAASRAIEDPDSRVLLSAAVVWEITIKRALGKLTVPAGYAKLLLDAGAIGLPVSLSHAAGVGDLPAVHGDPFDRLLIAQAISEDAVIATRDRIFAAYQAPVIW